MARVMKAAVIREFGAPLTIEDMPVPEPGGGQIVVKIAALRISSVRVAPRKMPS